MFMKKRLDAKKLSRAEGDLRLVARLVEAGQHFVRAEKLLYSSSISSPDVVNHLEYQRLLPIVLRHLREPFANHMTAFVNLERGNMNPVPRDPAVFRLEEPFDDRMHVDEEIADGADRDILHSFETELILRSVEDPEVFSGDQLRVDMGDKEAALIEREFGEAHFDNRLGCLGHFGVCSRWRHFFNWLGEFDEVGRSNSETIIQFARYLGRVTSYRALALPRSAFESVVQLNAIVSTGRLHVSEDRVRHLIREIGVKRICRKRLYMNHAIDPSLSLHDDKETAMLIASTFLKPGCKVYLFEVSVPLIETIGFTVYDIQSDVHAWFDYHGVWFDATKWTTERYILNEVSFLAERTTAFHVFESVGEIQCAVQPFKERQLAKKREWDAAKQT